jgi:hypothetical protein
MLQPLEYKRVFSERSNGIKLIPQLPFRAETGFRNAPKRIKRKEREMIEIVWEFEVAEENWAEFERHYGPNGTWAVLFRHSAEYGGTTLLRELGNVGVFVTVDRWKSREGFEEFQRRYGEQYRRTDEELERLTMKERRLGTYVEVAGSQAAAADESPMYP